MDDVIFLEWQHTRGRVCIGGGKGRLTPFISLKEAKPLSEIEAEL